VFGHVGGCRPFKENLVGLYNAWNENKKVIEIVVVSGDNDSAGFSKTVTGYPWLALERDSPSKASAGAQVPCTGYPTPGFCDAKTGKVIIADAFDENWQDGAALLEKIRNQM